MKSNNYMLIEYVQYYIWWVLNCSQNVSPEQIDKEITSVIEQVNKIYLETGDFREELYALEQIKLFACEINEVNLYNKEIENSYEEEWKNELRWEEEWKNELEKDWRDQILEVEDEYLF